MAGKTANLNIKNLRGHSVSVALEDAKSVGAIKEKACSLFDISLPYKTRLFYRGLILDDSDEIDSLFINPDDFLVLMEVGIEQEVHNGQEVDTESNSNTVEPKPNEGGFLSNASNPNEVFEFYSRKLIKERVKRRSKVARAIERKEKTIKQSSTRNLEKIQSETSSRYSIAKASIPNSIPNSNDDCALGSDDKENRGTRLEKRNQVHEIQGDEHRECFSGRGKKKRKTVLDELNDNLMNTKRSSFQEYDFLINEGGLNFSDIQTTTTNAERNVSFENFNSITSNLLSGKNGGDNVSDDNRKFCANFSSAIGDTSEAHDENEDDHNDSAREETQEPTSPIIRDLRNEEGISQTLHKSFKDKRDETEKSVIERFPLPPQLVELEKKFHALNSMSCLYEKRNLKMEWINIQNSLLDLNKRIGLQICFNDVKILAKLFPKLITLAELKKQNECISFTISFSDNIERESNKQSSNSFSSATKFSNQRLKRIERDRNYHCRKKLFYLTFFLHTNYLRFGVRDIENSKYDPFSEGNWHQTFNLVSPSLSYFIKLDFKYFRHCFKSLESCFMNLKRKKSIVIDIDEKDFIFHFHNTYTRDSVPNPNKNRNANEFEIGDVKSIGNSIILEEHGNLEVENSEVIKNLCPTEKVKDGHVYLSSKNPSFPCKNEKSLSVLELLEHIKSDIATSNQIVHIEHFDAKPACYSDLNYSFSIDIKHVCEKIGITKLYSHQAEAMNFIMENKDVIISTATSSGKSICFNFPVIERLLNDEKACAIYIFPTKALAQDQLRSVNQILLHLKGHIDVAVYDGDTCHESRSQIRSKTRLMITNPDMLHVSILPNHKNFARIFENLKFIVLDECHFYQGVFGSHVALIFRRLIRLCSKFYGSNPKFILCSATIGNPKEFSKQLLGLNDITLISNSGSPVGEKYFLFWNPFKCKALPLSEERKENHKRRYDCMFNFSRVNNNNFSNSIYTISSLFSEVIQHNLSCIVFCKTRKLCEIVVALTKRMLKEKFSMYDDLICVYRGGYSVLERREIEEKFISGQLKGICSTNVLELGVNFQNVLVTLHLGLPQTLSSFWQQSGRSGRNGKASFSVFVAFDSFVDQYFVKHPKVFFSRPIECACINPNNIQLLSQHIACAAFESPFHLESDETFFTTVHSSLDESLKLLKENFIIGRNPHIFANDSSLHYLGPGPPAQRVSIRSIEEEKFVLIEKYTEDVVEEMERSRAFYSIYEGAVFLKQGQKYLVKKFDLENRQAICEKSEVKYSTKVLENTEIKLIGGYQAYAGKIFNKPPISSAQFNFCEISTRIYGYQKIFPNSLRDDSSEILNLPDISYQTQAAWLRIPIHIKRRIEKYNFEFYSSLHGCSHAILNALPLILSCSTSDVGCECPRMHKTIPSRILLFEKNVGGVGIVEQVRDIFPSLLKHSYENVSSCECESNYGCPSCIQTHFCSTDQLSKTSTLALLQELIQEEGQYQNEKMNGGGTNVIPGISQEHGN